MIEIGIIEINMETMILQFPQKKGTGMGAGVCSDVIRHLARLSDPLPPFKCGCKGVGVPQFGCSVCWTPGPPLQGCF